MSLCCLLSLSTASFAFDVTLAWDANAEPVAGYKIHYGFSKGNYEVHTDLGKVTTHKFLGLPDGPTYYFAVTAYDGATESGYSNEVVYPETVSTPQPPSGPTTVQAWAAYQYTAAGAVSNAGDAVEYRFHWSDNTDSGWLPVGTVTATKRWETAATFTDVKVEARCAAHPDVISGYSIPITVTVDPAPGEVVTDPSPPAGPSDARTGVVYGYTTGGARSSFLGDPLQYRFQWGDGTASDWTDPGTDGTVKAWKSWSAAAIYEVVAEARCALHPGVTEVSVVAPVSVVSGDALRLADSFSDGTAAGDPQWKALSGRWVVGADKVFTAARTDAVNRAVVRALAGFKAGRISAKLKLTKRSLKQETGIIFAVKDAQHYRYVTLSGSRIVIGQRGNTAKVKAGVKASAARSFAADRWHQVRVDILANRVNVFLGTSRRPVLTYRFEDAPAGSVGCLAAKSVAYFDDYRVWDARVLH